MITRRIWFNKSFSSVYNVIRLLRHESAPGKFHVICSHPNPDFVGFQPSHECWQEPLGLSSKAYVEYCLDFCEKHAIDVFIPGKEKDLLAEHREAFAARGVRMMVAAESATMRHFERKAEFYANLEPSVAIAPRFFTVNTATQFRAACETLRAEGFGVCIKPSISTGGLGFHILDDSRADLRNLFGGETVRMTTAAAENILSQEPTFRDLLVMEYLDGAEYSIDCIADRGRLIRAVARRKPTRIGGAQLLEDAPALIDLSARLTAKFSLTSIYNIQVRLSRGVPKVLEINARMSGGVYFACLSGLNLPGWAIALLCGDVDEAMIPQPKLGIHVQQQYHEFEVSRFPESPVS